MNMSHDKYLIDNNNKDIINNDILFDNIEFPKLTKLEFLNEFDLLGYKGEYIISSNYSDNWLIIKMKDDRPMENGGQFKAFKVIGKSVSHENINKLIVLLNRFYK